MKFRSMLRGAAAAAITLTGLAALPAHAQFASITLQTWTLVRPSVCYTSQFNNNGVYTDYIYVYVDNTGANWISSIDPGVTAVMANFCANGNAFYVHSSDGTTWDAALLYPGLQ